MYVISFYRGVIGRYEGLYFYLRRNAAKGAIVHLFTFRVLVHSMSIPANGGFNFGASRVNVWVHKGRFILFGCTSVLLLIRVEGLHPMQYMGSNFFIFLRSSIVTLVIVSGQYTFGVCVHGSHHVFLGKSASMSTRLVRRVIALVSRNRYDFLSTDFCFLGLRIRFVSAISSLICAIGVVFGLFVSVKLMQFRIVVR